MILKSLDAVERKLNNSISALNSKIKEIDQNFMDLPSQEIEYARLERVYNSNEKYYTMLLEKRTEYAISKAGFVSETRVLQRARIPMEPISPNPLIIYLAGASLAIFVILLMIAIRYLTHNEITDVSDLARQINPSIGLLGIIPKYSKNIPMSQLIIDKNPKSVMAEAFRSIRTNLDFFDSESDKKVIAVTSTISGEGKTFVAINLGGIIAFGGKKVIILDLDMRKPRIHKGFNTTNEYGISTLLSGRDQLGNIIKKSELEGLHFITAGPVPPNPSELIINGRLQETLKLLKEQYDVIIIDNPPVGLVTDGISNLKLADYPIYVFRSEYSKKNFVFNVNRIFAENKIKNLTVVLNGMDLNRPRYGGYGRGYGYTYGYGYGYGSSSNGSGYYADDEEDDRKGFMRNLRKKQKSA